ncbi:MAG TPA: phosphotransferase, partial [Nitrospiria bacterium]|nr:phosphotransferase [Nitrospiria bacterium]
MRFGIPFPLIESLKKPEVYPHAVKALTLVETHISWVVLTGDYAYKIKKPVNLGFVDFSTLEKRKYYCEEELRLNRRLAPEIYLDIVKIAGSPAAPVLNGPGVPFEYAVRMKQFNRESELDRLVSGGIDLAPQFDDFATALARFHRSAEPAGRNSSFGTPEVLSRPMRENFEQIDDLVTEEKEGLQLSDLRAWTESELQKTREYLVARKNGGFIRECHGDLHLANMVLIDNKIVVFDCLEFNENLRFIDVMSDMAFLLMDLEEKGKASLSARFLNAYLERSGDYEGITILRLYRVYRAMVRAKVASIRAGQQESGPERKRLIKESREYIRMASRNAVRERPFMAITTGPSGSGKSVLARGLGELFPAVVIRTDAERKRLALLDPLDKSRSAGLEGGLYS